LRLQVKKSNRVGSQFKGCLGQNTCTEVLKTYKKHARENDSCYCFQSRLYTLLKMNYWHCCFMS
jgi:hypothetical protein